MWKELTAKEIDRRIKDLYGERLKLARKRLDLRQADVAEKIGLKNPQTYGHYEQGRRLPRSPGIELRISQLLGVSVGEAQNEVFRAIFVSNEQGVPRWRLSPADPGLRPIPLAGEVHAGGGKEPAASVTIHEDWQVSGEWGDQVVDIGRHMFHGACLAKNTPIVGVRVNGESMKAGSGAGYHDEDLLLVEVTPEKRDGDHVVADLYGDGSYTLKKYSEKGRILLPLNPDNDPLREEDYPDTTIFGRVVAMFRVKG